MCGVARSVSRHTLTVSRHALSDSRKAGGAFGDPRRFSDEGGRVFGDGPGLYSEGRSAMGEGIWAFGYVDLICGVARCVLEDASQVRRNTGQECPDSQACCHASP